MVVLALVEVALVVTKHSIVVVVVVLVVAIVVLDVDVGDGVAGWCW